MFIWWSPLALNTGFPIYCLGKSISILNFNVLDATIFNSFFSLIYGRKPVQFVNRWKGTITPVTAVMYIINVSLIQTKNTISVQWNHKKSEISNSPIGDIKKSEISVSGL